MCKIVVFDTYPLISSGLCSILGKIDDFKIICEAKQAEQARVNLGNNIPDVIIIDVLHMENGAIKPIKKVRRYFPKTPILLILSEFYSLYFEEYLRLGVKGFVFKDARPDDLISAVKSLSGGEDYFPDKVWVLLKNVLRSNKSSYSSNNLTSTLSDREITIVRHFSQGYTYKEIGNKLSISSRTVESHKRNILEKLKVKSTIEMVKYAMVNNLIS